MVERWRTRGDVRRSGALAVVGDNEGERGAALGGDLVVAASGIGEGGSLWSEAGRRVACRCGWRSRPPLDGAGGC